MIFQRCPVCEGRGEVPAGFYPHEGFFWVPPAGGEQCRTCRGLGVITTPIPFLPTTPWPAVPWRPSTGDPPPMPDYWVSCAHG